MTKYLIRKYIPKYEDTANGAVRSRYIMLSGIMGIVCNGILFAVKLMVGLFMGSMAVMSDAFNNLSDMGNSVISAVSARLSSQKPDEEHPYGHGRIEYVASLVVSFLILMVGFELFRSSFGKLLTEDQIRFHWITVGILCLSMLIKVWMFVYNRYMGKAIDSTVLRAASADSISDVMATGAVVLSTILAQFVHCPFSIDGAMGLIVSLLIMKAGLGIAKETIDLLLGAKPDPMLVKEIEKVVLSGDGIVGVHDLIIHDYGPGRRFASVHAEVPDDGDIVHVHEVIDALEQKVLYESGTILVIHMDPIRVGDTYVDTIQADVKEIIREVDESYTIHDFRITDGTERINLIFDLVVPRDQKAEEITGKVNAIKEKVRERDPRYAAVIKAENSMI